MIGQRADRFEAQVALLQVRVAGHDVGRVGDDQVELTDILCAQRQIPVALQKLHAHMIQRRIAPRQRQRGGADIDRGHLRVGPAVRQRDRDRAGTGAEVKYRAVLRQPFQRQFHQQFGFRPRNQHIARDRESQAVELALADQIGDRFRGQEGRVRAAHAEIEETEIDRVERRVERQRGEHHGGGEQQSIGKAARAPACCRAKTKAKSLCHYHRCRRAQSRLRNTATSTTAQITNQTMAHIGIDSPRIGP